MNEVKFSIDLLERQWLRLICAIIMCALMLIVSFLLFFEAFRQLDERQRMLNRPGANASVNVRKQ